jgi:uncharacterized protein
MTASLSAASSAVALAPCARCASVRRTCCQRADILLTERDVERIAAHANGLDFHERRAPGDPSYFDADEDDPAWLGLTLAADGTRRMLRRQPNGDCIFLGEAGCALTSGTRPLVCRLYPFSYNEGGLTGRDEHYCPTDLLAPGGQPMADVLGIDAGSAEGWRASLYEELRHGRP